MKKTIPVVFNLILLCWFFLDMIGVYFGDKYLVTTSYKEDWAFLLIFIAALLFFIIRENIGKYILSGWLICWLVAQFFSHWYFTIAGGAEGKIRYFADAVKLFESSGRYIPDLYHIVLHVLIALALAVTVLYEVFGRKESRRAA